MTGRGLDNFKVIQINLEDRSLHIRIAQIVYFEGALASYV